MTDAKFDPAEYVRRSRPRRMVDLFGLTLATDSTDPAECQLEARLFTLHTAEGEGHNQAVPDRVYERVYEALDKSPNVSREMMEAVSNAMRSQLDHDQHIIIVARAPVFAEMATLLKKDPYGIEWPPTLRWTPTTSLWNTLVTPLSRA